MLHDDPGEKGFADVFGVCERLIVSHLVAAVSAGVVDRSRDAFSRYDWNLRNTTMAHG
jgi:hypothetical protein